MENRSKVILHKRDGWNNDIKLALTEDHIKLLYWLMNDDIIPNDDWDIQVLSEAEVWIAV